MTCCSLRNISGVLIFGVLTCIRLLSAFADSPTSPEAAPVVVDSSTVKASPGFPDSPGVKLAQQELPELVSVLERLNRRSPAQFDKAVKELDRAAKRLENLQHRDPSAYESALAEWRMRARLDVLKAKHKAKPSKETEAAVESQQQSIVAFRKQHIEQELKSISAREKPLNERIQQARQMLERGEQRRQQLLAELAKLSEPKSDFKASAKAIRNKPQDAATDQPSKSEIESRE